MSSDWIADDLALLIDAAQKAGEIAHSYFGRSPETWYKGKERSPVSEADMASDRFLRDTLLAARPSYGWLSEETLDDPSRLARERIFIVDPIDGTRGFIGGKTDWCVSVAIVENGVAVVGALASPARGNIWWASRGNGAFLNSERLSGCGSQADASAEAVDARHAGRKGDRRTRFSGRAGSGWSVIGIEGGACRVG